MLDACKHDDMEGDERAVTHTLRSEGQPSVVVTSIAFGLDIDNQYTRFVKQATLATSIARYFQESGQSGRDGRRGRSIVLQRAGELRV